MKSVSVSAGEWMNFRFTVFHSAKPKHNQSWVDGIREARGSCLQFRCWRVIWSVLILVQLYFKRFKRDLLNRVVLINQ